MTFFRVGGASRGAFFLRRGASMASGVGTFARRIFSIASSHVPGLVGGAQMRPRAGRDLDAGCRVHASWRVAHALKGSFRLPRTARFENPDPMQKSSQVI